MIKYGKLSKFIAEECQIRQGKNESESNFKSRIIYSALCRLAYASLWDKPDDEKSAVTVEHFTEKIAELLKIYLQLYPEVKIAENLGAKIYDLYLKNGYLHHKPKRISAAIFSCTKLGEMFLLPEKNLVDTWQEIISAENWHAGNLPDDAEFNYLPPQELYLWTLYSWAQNPAVLPNNFKRVFTTEIFFCTKEINAIHAALCTEPEDYIKSQYFGKSPLLLAALSDKLKAEGVLHKKPYVESAPTYKISPNALDSIKPAWLREFFLRLAAENPGVYPSLFVHQVQALTRQFPAKIYS